MDKYGPFMSYKSIFKRKNRIYRLGDIRIPFGITLEQFISCAIILSAEGFLFFIVPGPRDLSLAFRIVVMIASMFGTYKLLGMVDFKGMGLLTFLQSLTKWGYAPKRTLMDQPVKRVKKKEQIRHEITSGYAVDGVAELVHITNISSIILDGPATITIKDNVLKAVQSGKRIRQTSVSEGAEIAIDKKRSVQIKLAHGVHFLDKKNPTTLVYRKGGSYNNGSEISDKVLDESFDF